MNNSKAMVLLFRPFLLPLFLVLFFIFHIPSANAQDPLWLDCENTASYTNTSTFGRNLEHFFSFVSTANLDKGSANESFGDRGEDMVYGIAQCRGDAIGKVCKDCLGNASNALRASCPNKSATIWYDNCLLRYSNGFFGSSNTSLWVYMWNTQNVTDAYRFDNVLDKVMKNISNRAASEQPGSALFATGRANLSPFSNLYGLAQCINDITPSQCGGCLGDAIRQIPNCCDGKRGGRVIGAFCNIRFELYKFYEGSDIEVVDPVAEAPVPTPFTSPSPSTDETIAGGREHNSSRISTAVLVTAITAAVILFVFLTFCLLWKTCLQKKKKKKKKNTTAIDVIEVADKSFLVNFDRLRAATNDFSEENKLGEGGFGPVYKATLLSGQEIAVKRLSVNSGQGVLEFKNEIALIAKLHHKNLVRLFGCCVDGEEKLLIYEYIPNRSLDFFLFDPVKSASLNWECRYKIIGGIARGLLYLHEESQLKIIHRDLKASNILLDANMNPKISDFGMAKIFQVEQTQANTSRIAGTYGYMSPEYVTNGQFSVKSDVFSFGVLLLEILCGHRNNTFYQTNLADDLLSYVWRAWTKGIALEIIDSTMSGHFPISTAMRCIHIGLLCVQNDPTARPNISSVAVMLNSLSITLPAPSPPAFFISSKMEPSLQLHHSSQENSLDLPRVESKTASINDASITEIKPR